MKKTFLLLGALLAGPASAPLQAQTTQFAKGADVSWIAEMEAAGRLFYNSAGVQQPLLPLLKTYDLNTIRLRVWVNPAGGLNGKADVIAKAIRARDQGYRLMIDFHYSDNFADPGKQTKPAAWQNYTLAQLKQAVYDHTVDVLTDLKANGIVPEWVQVGNETNDGMLWPEGRISVGGMSNFAQLIDQGYAAVKAVDPTAKVIVHIANGYNNGAFRYIFDGLAVNGARYDVVGMSHYPTTANWPTLNTQLQANMNDMVSRYPGKEVMVVETGMPYNAPIPSRQMLTELQAKVRAVPGSKGLGVLYWEPEAYNWQGYTLGAWQNNGQPTIALDAFRNPPPSDGLVYNPGFEYTAATQSPLGWTTTSTADADADLTQNYGRASLYQLGHQKATAYQVRTSQQLTSLPSGTYTLRAWVQSSGGQNVCQLYANGFGGAERNVNLTNTNGDWVQLTISNIAVTNGQCEIGLRSDAHAGESCSLDDVEFFASQVTATTPATINALGTQVFPNPAQDRCTVSYTLPQAETVQLSLLDLTGRPVQAPAPAQRQVAGLHRQELTLDAGLAPGVYLLRIAHGEQQTTQKIIRF